MTHYVASSFTNKEEALKWFMSHNKVTTEYNSVHHDSGWTTKDWGKKESTETEAGTDENKESENEKTPSEMACDAIRNYTALSDEDKRAVVGLEEMLDQAEDASFIGDFDKLNDISKRFNTVYYDLLDKVREIGEKETEQRIERVKNNLNRLLADSFNTMIGGSY